MKILSLGSDSQILDKNSAAAKRALEYGGVVDAYFVLVPDAKNEKVSLSNKVCVFAAGGKTKLARLINLYLVAQKIVKKEKIDVITSQDPFEFGLVAYLVAKKFGIAFNVQEHGDFFAHKYWREENWLNHIRYFVGLFVIKRAQSIRVVCEKTKKKLIEIYKIKKEKIVKVSVFVPTEQKDLSLYKRLEGLEGKFVFFCQGRFVKQKNLFMLIRAFCAIAEKHHNARLLMVGKGPEKEDIRNMIKASRLENKITLLGWTDDIYKYFASADAYVLPSNYEGYGRVIIEAITCGVPIVMTDVGCAGELVKNNKSALISRVNDEDGFKENMERIYRDSQLRKLLVENAKNELLKLPHKKKTLALYLKSWEKARENLFNKKKSNHNSNTERDEKKFKK